MNIFKWHRDHSERWFDRMGITTRYGAAWLGLIKGIIMTLIVMCLMSCKKDDTADVLTPKEDLVCATVRPQSLSDWIFTSQIYHTKGLETMAISGSINDLYYEWCGEASTSSSLTSILGTDHPSDFEHKVWASTITKDGYHIAMFHPTDDYPDSFIIVNVETLQWYRFDLGKMGVYRGVIKEHSRG